MEPTELPAARVPLETVHAAAAVLRSMLTQCTTPAEMAQGLADAGLLLPAEVYRAEIDSIPLGTYVHADHARRHCVDDRAHHRGNGAATWEPHGGAEAGLFDLWVGGEATDYAVVPIPLHTAYDPDGQS